MILHKIEDGLMRLDQAIHRHVKQFIGLFLLWCVTFALWFFPLSRIVIDAGPKGDSNGAANVMEVFGTIVGVVTIVLSLIWLYGIEEFVQKRRTTRAEDAVLAQVDSIRALRDKEEILGLKPYPLDDDAMERYLYEPHPIEQDRQLRSGAYLYGRYAYSDRPPGTQRIRSKGYDALLEELTPHG